MTEWARGWGKYVLVPVSQVIRRIGISPNLVSSFGFVVAMMVAWFMAHGQIQVGGIVYIFSGISDAVDGTLARVTGVESRFGAFLDSTLDRISEAVVFLGLALYYNGQGDQVAAVLLYATLVMSFLVSYTRARAEGLGLECKVGIGTRMERFVILLLGMWLNRALISVGILLVLATITTLQRIYHVWYLTEGKPHRSS